MYTYQDFMDDRSDISSKINKVINAHRTDPDVKLAQIADDYDRCKNTTIMNYVKYVYSNQSGYIADTTASTNKLCSSFFRRLNTQRNTYSLGNGITFDEDGVKEKLGQTFDTEMKSAGYKALIHGVSFVFWNVNRVHVFKLTEFAPLWDEETGALRAGIRYWQLDSDKPIMAVLYEEDGYTKYKSKKLGDHFEEVEPKRAYRMKISKAPADDEPEIIGEDNYDVLPIVPLYGSELKQSTLIGMQGKIDAYDLIRSGYANDLEDCAEIYWIVSNAGGMDRKDLDEFRRRLKNEHVVNVENADEVSITPYTQEIPFNSREAFLNNIRAGIYEDFGGLDVHTIAAGATNDHIDAAYQPMDENADDFEYQIIECVQQLLLLQGIEATPLFKRNRISNQAEYTNMILASSEYLDTETILNKLPFLTPDEVDDIIKRKDEEDVEQFKEPEEETEAEE